MTEKREYPLEPPCPPSIETATLAGEVSAPLSEIIVADRRAAVTMPDGGMPVNEVSFRVDIRDCNETQRLQANVFLNSTGLLSGREVVPERRSPFEFDVPYPLLGAGGNCRRVQLYVSSGFEADDRTPLEEGDLGTATWWIAVIDDTTTAVDMQTCPQ